MTHLKNRPLTAKDVEIASQVVTNVFTNPLNVEYLVIDKSIIYEHIEQANNNNMRQLTIWYFEDEQCNYYLEKPQGLDCQIVIGNIHASIWEKLTRGSKRDNSTA